MVLPRYMTIMIGRINPTRNQNLMIKLPVKGGV